MLSLKPLLFLCFVLLWLYPPYAGAIAPSRERAQEIREDRAQTELQGKTNTEGEAAQGVSLAPEKASGVLRLYNWPDYIGSTTLDDFTQRTGVRVVSETFEANEELEAALFSGKAYDIVVPSATPYLSRLLQAGMFQPLAKEQVPNFKNLDATLMSNLAAADPGNRHAIIYLWGTSGIGYNVDAVQQRLLNAPVQSWDLILKPENLAKLADCGVNFLDSGSEVFPIILRYLGLNPNSESPLDLEAAVDHMLKLRPYIRSFESGDYGDELAAGSLCVVLGWSGDIGQAQTMARVLDGRRRIEYSLPKEGTYLWFDVMAIPATAANPVAAHAFINFLLEPAVMAGITRDTHFANAVPASLSLLSQEMVDNPLVFPPAILMQRNFTLQQPSPSYERLRTKAWQRVVSGQ